MILYERCAKWKTGRVCDLPGKPMSDAIAELQASTRTDTEKVQMMILILDAYKVTNEETRQAYLDALVE